MVVTVENGRPVKVQGSKTHPYNKGWLCAKGKASLDFLYSPQRLSSPLMKKDGDFVVVEWEEALDFAAKKLQNLRDRYGPQSLAIYQGALYLGASQPFPSASGEGGAMNIRTASG